MATTSDPNHPDLTRGPDPANSTPGMAPVYLVLTDAERAAGFVAPVRRTYIHHTCGTTTTIAQTIAETYARNPTFYGSTYCATCYNHRPIGETGEFTWAGTTIKVGTNPPA
jgi:hypothetical protein